VSSTERPLIEIGDYRLAPVVGRYFVSGAIPGDRVENLNNLPGEVDSNQRYPIDRAFKARKFPKCLSRVWLSMSRRLNFYPLYPLRSGLLRSM
jgi:hypothetical protein